MDRKDRFERKRIHIHILHRFNATTKAKHRTLTQKHRRISI